MPKKEAKKKRKLKKGVVAITYKIGSDGERQYLLLHRVFHWTGWEFVKGGIDEGAKQREALLNELKEEAGIKNKEIEKVLRTPFKLEFISKTGKKHVMRAFLVQVNPNAKPTTKHNPFPEHDEFCWADEKRVLKLLEWTNTSKLFKKILRWKK